MDKGQALHAFWSGFGLPAYDATSVPEDAALPYLTYMVATDSIGNAVPMTASLWYRSTSWEEISRKADEIAEYIVTKYPPAFAFDGGRIYITKGTPFQQRMSDPEPFIKRILLTIDCEYFCEY